MKRLAMTVAALAAFALAACGGETEPATDLTPTSAKLHAIISCKSDLSGTWYFETRQQLGMFPWVQRGTPQTFNCPADQDPGTPGYQCTAGVCHDIPIALTVSLTSGVGYQFRIAADIDDGGSGTHAWADRNGDVDGTNYDDIPASR